MYIIQICFLNFNFKYMFKKLWLQEELQIKPKVKTKSGTKKASFTENNIEKGALDTEGKKQKQRH